MTKLKEKDIVNYIKSNWDKYFLDLKFYKTEFSLRDFRVDIAAQLTANLKDLKIREEDYIYNVPVFFEVKYNSEMRDLMFELQKQIKFRNFYINNGKCFCMICVISDEFNHHMVQFMENNNIEMFKINIEDDNLETMTITEYNSFVYHQEDMKELCPI